MAKKTTKLYCPGCRQSPAFNVQYVVNGQREKTIFCAQCPFLQLINIPRQAELLALLKSLTDKKLEVESSLSVASSGRTDKKPVPFPSSPAVNRVNELTRLKKAMREAVQHEDYERAAIIRDQIKGIEEHPPGGNSPSQNLN